MSSFVSIVHGAPLSLLHDSDIFNLVYKRVYSPQGRKIDSCLILIWVFPFENFPGEGTFLWIAELLSPSGNMLSRASGTINFIEYLKYKVRN